MVKGKHKQVLNLENILKKISEYDIYRYYIGTDFKIGKGFHSPFHKDENPSFSVIVTKGGFLHHLDFADTTKKGNCVNFIQQLYNIDDYKEALEKIDRDFGLGISHSEKKDYSKIIGAYTQPTLEKRNAFIQVVSRRFDSAELAYWKSYYITEKMLKENDVYAIKKLYLNRRLFPLSITELAFAYLEEDKWKIYRPFAPDKRSKWMTNVPNDRMSGMRRITEGCKIAVVTKSKKDEMLLSNFLNHVCSVQSESTVSISNENIQMLQTRCGRTYLNFDSDEVGVQSCKYYNQFGFGWVNCPKGYKTKEGLIIKDFADLAKHHGIDTVINHFKTKGLL